MREGSSGGDGPERTGGSLMPVTAPSHLGTLASTAREVKQKHAEKTRLETKDDFRKLDERKLAEWRRAVGDADGWTDRFTGQKTERTLEQKPERAEAHHHERRENRDVRYDVRNGIHLSLKSHQRIKLGTLQIVATKGSKFYVVNGRRYLNMRGPVKFVETTK